MGFVVLSVVEPLCAYTEEQLVQSNVTDDTQWGCRKVSELRDTELSALPQVKLSGDIGILVNDPELSSKTFSYAFFEDSKSLAFKIVNPEQTDLTAGMCFLDGYTKGIVDTGRGQTETCCIWRYENDDNGIYLPVDPSYGNQALRNFYGNHSEGGSTRAIGKYSHAEGRDTVADVRYSHSEGSHTFAGGMAAHSEGFSTRAPGRFSHSAGNNAYADDDISWVWSSGAKYGSHGYGTFNINPVGGINGFYIGGNPLSFYLNWDAGSEIIVVKKPDEIIHTDSRGTSTTYGSIHDALIGKRWFGGVVRFECDVTTELASLEDYEVHSGTTHHFCNMGGRKLKFDLGGHTWRLSNALNARCLMLYCSGNCDVTVTNGRLALDNISLCSIYGGKVALESATVDTNMRIDISPWSKSSAKLTVDSGSVVNFRYEYFNTRQTSSDTDYDNYSCGFFVFGSGVSKSQFPDIDSYDNAHDFISAHRELCPELVIDGKVRSRTDSEGNRFDITATNGTKDRFPPIITVNRGARLEAERGCALFNNTLGEININGGTIIGETAVIVRSGYLNVPFDSDAVIMGTGDADYDTGHPGGSGTSLLNQIGNGILIESVPVYGAWSFFETDKNGHAPVVKIESGRFYSKRREAIGSYSHAKDKTGSAFCERVEKFMTGGWMDSFPSGNEYDYVNGTNPDYNLVADGFTETVPCQIVMN